jgi:streptogramin lyase
VDEEGKVVITGMFTHRMYVLDPSTGRMAEVAIPVERANPRAVELAANGDWWVVLGGPHKLARYTPALGLWKTFDAGVYAHSVALAPDGRAWFNGHFTKSPELIGYADVRSGEVKTVPLPPHPELAGDPGGPIPYEIRVAPDGRVWMSELQGNRLVVHDPASGRSEAHVLPETFGGPRRFDVDSSGTLWVPAYAGNALLEFVPSTGRWASHALPVRDAVPYVARVHPTTGNIWVGTSAADALMEWDPRRRAWATYDLPSRGAMVRHLAFDRRNGDVWAAYGASPGIAARVARIRVK